MNADKEYFRLLDLILSQGRVKKNRTGTDTIGVFGAQARFDLQKGFPLLTTKKVNYNAIIHELLWFISGSNNIKYLVDNGVNIWNKDAYRAYKQSNDPNKPIIIAFDADGDERETELDLNDFIEEIKTDNDFARRWGELGQGTYGGMWRAFPYPKFETGNQHEYWKVSEGNVDQLAKVIDKLKTNPDDRRMIVSAWHPYYVDHCALPPCHCLFHFNTEELTHEERCNYWQIGPAQHWEINPAQLNQAGCPTRKLNCLLYQRSCDTFLGVPFNIASYALLTHLIAKCVNMVAGDFIHTYGDLHLYSNHIEQAKIQLTREPKILPTLVLKPEVNDLFKVKFEDIKIEGYDPHPPIKGELSAG
jgi:thymidylate synthase